MTKLKKMIGIYSYLCEKRIIECIKRIDPAKLTEYTYCLGQRLLVFSFLLVNFPSWVFSASIERCLQRDT